MTELAVTRNRVERVKLNGVGDPRERLTNDCVFRMRGSMREKRGANAPCWGRAALVEHGHVCYCVCWCCVARFESAGAFRETIGQKEVGETIVYS